PCTRTGPQAALHGPRTPPWPTRARCCVRTVQAALRAAADLGLIAWSERRVRAGWRWLRTSNLYRFIVPAGPVSPSCSTTGKPCRRSESEEVGIPFTHVASRAGAGSLVVTI